MGVLFILSLLTACNENKMDADKSWPAFTPENVTPELVWKRISKEAPFHKYSFWPGYEGMQEGSVPHGPFHKLYINSILKKALPVSNSIAPLGTIIVKENFDRDQEPMGIYIMAKVQGFDPAHNDWYWARYNPDGTEATGGKLDSCITCHLGASDNDYLFLNPLNGED